MPRGEVGAGAAENELAAARIEQGVVFDEHFPRGEIGQPAVDGGRAAFPDSAAWGRGSGGGDRVRGEEARSQAGTEFASHRHWNAAGDPSGSRATRNAVGIAFHHDLIKAAASAG